MLIYIADDEPLLLEDLHDAVQCAEPAAQIRAFAWAQPVLDALKQGSQKPDVAFLDIEMPGMSGMELARAFRQISPQTRLVFVTGFTQYAVEAFSIHADGYIMKPVTPQLLRAELRHLQPLLAVQPQKRIRARCFGSFEVYLDGEPMTFQYNKTRELFAYLISRNGALCSNGEIMAALWEDESGEERKKEYYKKLRADLRQRLETRGLGDVLVQQRGMLGITAKEIDCDYFNWLKGKPESGSPYSGEFMRQYSWSEALIGSIAQN